MLLRDAEAERDEVRVQLARLNAREKRLGKGSGPEADGAVSAVLRCTLPEISEKVFAEAGL